MATEIVLLDNIEHLGNVGETVTVKDGYARNYLLPQGLAVPATKAVVRQIESRKAKVQAEYEAAVVAAQALAGKVAETSVTIPMQAGEDEKLFGSVTNQDIAKALTEDGFDIDRKLIDLPEPLKALGVFEVAIKLHKEVTATLKVWVVKA